MSQERADALLPGARAGVNHLDTAAAYGESELRLAPWLAAHRRDFFLATKTGERTGTRPGPARTVARAAGRRPVDLIQLHNLVEPDEWEVALRSRRRRRGARHGRDEGLVRFIGVTGHGLRIATMHLRSLESSTSTRSCSRTTSRCCRTPRTGPTSRSSSIGVRRRDVAVQTIKSVARRRWTDDSDPHFSWYEPCATRRPRTGRPLRPGPTPALPGVVERHQPPAPDPRSGGSPCPSSN